MSYNCNQCDFCTINYYRLKKHKDIEHSDAKVHQCEKCNKLLSSKYILEKHREKCSGLNILQCKYCHELFANRKSKYNHTLTCKHKDDTMQNTIINDHSIIDNSITNNDNSVHNITNHNTTINNTTNNYNTTNVIKFEIDSREMTKFVTHHITAELVKTIIDKYLNLSHKHPHIPVIDNYSYTLFDIPENKCVKRKNNRAQTSSVHVGNGIWNEVPDRMIYDKLVRDTTKSFINQLDEVEKLPNITSTFQRKIYRLRESSQPFAEYIFDDERELLQQWRFLKENMKCLFYNRSK